jgi:predicted adenylyl cyclase CyaB
VQNLEIKCSYADHRGAERCARDQLRAIFFGKLVQTDTYFNIHPGRLKLRKNQRTNSSQKGPGEAVYELIAYRRPNRRTARTSAYDILPISDGPAALSFFTATFGIRVRVHKVRKVYLKDNLRIHLDSVRGLGKFLEFELIVSPAHPLTACRREMERLMTLFGITASHLIPDSYSDALLRRARDP